MAAAGRMLVREVDRGWNVLVNTMRLYAQAGSHVKVGVLDDGGVGSKPHSDDGLTVAELAAVHEFGTDDGHIPARPWIGGTFDKNRARYSADLKLLLVKVYEGKLTLDKVLAIMGMRMIADINRAVRSGDGIPPPNAPSTVAAKGSARPLIDTGRMLASLTYAVIMSGSTTEKGANGAD